MHDKAVRDKRVYDARVEEAKRAENNEELVAYTKTAKYRQFCFKGEKYSVIGCKDYDDLVNEGEVLNNCVATYFRDFVNGETNIYFIRRNDALDKPYFCTEVKKIGRFYRLERLFDHKLIETDLVDEYGDPLPGRSRAYRLAKGA